MSLTQSAFVLLLLKINSQCLNCIIKISHSYMHTTAPTPTRKLHQDEHEADELQQTTSSIKSILFVSSIILLVIMFLCVLLLLWASLRRVSDVAIVGMTLGFSLLWMQGKRTNY